MLRMLCAIQDPPSFAEVRGREKQLLVQWLEAYSGLAGGGKAG